MRRAASAPRLPTVVVVGNGMVAHRFCERLAEGELRYRVILVGDEPRLAYDRVHLTRILAGDHPAALELAGADWYSARGVSVVLGQRVERIDAAERAVLTQTGRRIPYDALVLATGARPFVPAIPGTDDARVHLYRSVDDLLRLRAAARRARAVTVLGGGLLGLEAARALADLGAMVTVVEAADRLMPRQLDEESSRILARNLEAAGIAVWCGRKAQSIVWELGRLVTRFEEDESTLTSDVLVVAAGIVPRDELAACAGIQRAKGGGFEVDAHLQTSAPGVYAIGECASFEDRIAGFVAPGYAMAEVLAARLRGAGEGRYVPGIPDCELKGAGVEVASIGTFDEDAEYYRYRTADGLHTLRVRRGRLVGLTSVGAWRHRTHAREAVRSQAPVSRAALRRFAETGELPSRLQLSVVSWDPGRLVCNCMHVTRGQLAAAMAGGARSVAALGASTGAGTLCGSCQPLLAELCQGSAGVAVAAPVAVGQGRRVWTLAASFLGATVVASMVLAGPPEVAQSVQARWHQLEDLWRVGWVKRLTGFSLLGISVLASLIAARKRLSWVRWGSFAWHRAVHTSLGLAALLLVVTHTGLRMGHNVNFALMVAFLTLCALGAITGWITYAEAGRDRLALLARRARPALTLAHLLAAWPMAVLLGFHILMAYYF